MEPKISPRRDYPPRRRMGVDHQRGAHVHSYRDPKAARLGCIIVVLGAVVGWGLVLGAIASVAWVIQAVLS